jgi:leucyl-tRNA synthetase
MGYDAYGLPAEQYAIQTGQHPAITTEKNIARYREQLDKIGFSYDWNREVRTCEPDYYKWTQWAFIQMFNHYYNPHAQKAQPIEKLIHAFETNGTQGIEAACSEELHFSAKEWNDKTVAEQRDILMNYRVAYKADTMVNWCPALGTVLANDEVSEGVSIRGGHSVEQRHMSQWSLRVSAYAQRLLNGLTTLAWSDSLKETQKNWIGRSEGAEMHFSIAGIEDKMTIFTTRPDTIFGVTFMVLAPESEWVTKLTTIEQQAEVTSYLTATKKKTERERIADKKVSGVFSGAYAVNPANGQNIPIWISDYVLAGYGTGAIMAVPAHDARDYAFAKNFNLSIIPVIEGCDVSNESFDAKEGILTNSEFLNGLTVKEAIVKAKEYIKTNQLGRVKVNFRLRDAIFSRQRYWGEPFPVYYKDGQPYTLDEAKLPLKLPEVSSYLPTEHGEPPLGRAANWQTEDGFPLELNTMPGFAGSSAYYLRYMDPHNDKALVSKEADEYWRNVDLYIGGTEHATGHLIYSRFWNKFLFDLGVVCEAEPFKKLINQGMIQGRSNFVYRLKLGEFAEKILWSHLLGLGFNTEFKESNHPFDFVNKEKKVVVEIVNGNQSEKISRLKHIATSEGYRIYLAYAFDVYKDEISARNRIIDFIASNSLFDDTQMYEIAPVFVSYNRKNEYETTPIHVDVNIVSNDILDIEAFKNWNPEYKTAEFILEDGKYICGWAVEKMSKSMYNVVNPDDIVEKYGADTLRLYEMFLGPLEQSKPWDTNGIDGVHRFLKKLWNLFWKEDHMVVSDETPSLEEWKALHKLLKKVKYDIENFSFNTSVSAFMICVNELTTLKCNKRSILEPLLIVLNPFAPHISEELWHQLGHKDNESICNAIWVEADEKYLQEDIVTYAISFNGKVRYQLSLPADMPADTVETTVLSSDQAQKWLEGKTPKKIIIVPKKIVNIVV